MNKSMMGKVTANRVSDLSAVLVDNMKYSDSSITYPSLDKAVADDGVIAEWFYPIYNAANDFSELSAILLYTNQEAIFEEIGELTLGIGMTEMVHLEKLGDLIKRLGGVIPRSYNNSKVEIGKSVKEALTVGIISENKAIIFYKNIKNKLSYLVSTPTIAATMSLLEKLLADETVHLDLLKAELKLHLTEEEIKNSSLYEDY